MQETKKILDITITTALAAVISGVADAFSIGSIRQLALLSKFVYGADGTDAKAWVQTTLDGGTTWFDIANFAATTASKSRIYNLSALTPKTTIYTPTDGTLADDTAIDGLLGALFRVKVTTTGTYSGGTTWQIFATPK